MISSVCQSTYVFHCCFIFFIFLKSRGELLLFFGCLTFQQQASVSQGRAEERHSTQYAQGGISGQHRLPRCFDMLGSVPEDMKRLLLMLVCCLTSRQHACVSQRRICSDSGTCCHTETEVADQTFCLTQSQILTWKKMLGESGNRTQGPVSWRPTTVK